MNYYEAGGVKLPLKLERRRIKNIYIDFKGGVLRIRYPYFCSEKDALSFAKSKEALILKWAEKNEKKEGFFLFGKQYDLHFSENARFSCYIKDAGVYLSGKDLPSAIDRFYREVAEKYIRERLLYISGKVSLNPEKLTLRKSKTRYGSCTKNGNISISIYLCRSGKEAIDYVLLHELCHLKEFSHNGDFYSLIERYMPDYKEAKKKLLGLMPY